MVLQLYNNSLETHVIQSLEGKRWTGEKQGAVTLPGHRSDVRTVTFSADNTTVLTGSGESIKVWNRFVFFCHYKNLYYSIKLGSCLSQKYLYRCHSCQRLFKYLVSYHFTLLGCSYILHWIYSIPFCFLSFCWPTFYQSNNSGIYFVKKKKSILIL